MALDPRLILGVQQPDIIGALSSGNELAAQVNQQNRQNALSDLYREQGAGILSGDRNALAALAGLDPTQALGIQTQQRQDTRQQQAFELDQRAQQQNMQYAQSREARAAQEYARSISAEQAAAEAAQIENAVKTGLLIPDAQQWDQVMSQQAPELVGQFNSRDALAAQYMTFAEVLKQRNGNTEFNADRYRVVGNQLYDLAGAEGPSVVGQAPGQVETVFGPDGNPILTRGPAGDVKFTEGQSKDVVFATRAEGALAKLDEGNPGALSNPVDRALDSDPTGIIRGAFQGDDYQLARQSGQEYLQAILRKDTGAAITPDEERQYGQVYLPQPGDGPAVLAQKAESRIRAVEALRSGMNASQFAATDRALVNAAQRADAQGQPPVNAVPQGAAMAAEPQREIVAPDIEPGIWDAMTPEEKALFQ